MCHFVPFQFHLRESKNLRYVRGPELKTVRRVLATPRTQPRIEGAHRADSSLGSLLILHREMDSEHQGQPQAHVISKLLASTTKSVFGAQFRVRSVTQRNNFLRYRELYHSMSAPQLIKQLCFSRDIGTVRLFESTLVELEHAYRRRMNN